MSKMDRQGARTPADLERKYNFGQSFAELLGIAEDAQSHAYQAEKALEEWTQRVGDDMTGVYAELDLKIGRDENNNLIGQVHIGADQLTIDTDNFTLDANGNVRIEGEIYATDGRIAKWDISEYSIFKYTDNYVVQIAAPESVNDTIISVGKLTNGEVTDLPFYLSADGFLYAKDGYFEGEIHAGAGYIGDWELDGNGMSYQWYSEGGGYEEIGLYTDGLHFAGCDEDTFIEFTMDITPYGITTESEYGKLQIGAAGLIISKSAADGRLYFASIYDESGSGYRDLYIDLSTNTVKVDTDA